LFSVAAVALWWSRPTPAARVALVVVLAVSLLDQWNDSARSCAAALRNQAGTSVALVLQRAVTVAVVVPVLVTGGGLVGLTVAFAAAYVVGFVTHQAALGRLGVRVHLRAVSRASLRAAAQGTAAVGVSAMVLAGLARLDTLMLDAFKGDRALGTYSAAYRLFETTLFVTFAAMSATYPVMSINADRPDRVRRSVEQTVAVLAVCYLAVGVVFVVDAREIIRLVYGPNYVSAVGALRWLAPAPLLFGLAFLASSALTATHRTGQVLAAAVVAAVVNVSVNLVAIPHLGGTGAALVTSLSYGVQAVIGLLLLARGIGVPRVTRAVVEPLVAAGVLAAVLVLLPWRVYVEVPLGIAGYAAVWLCLVIAAGGDRAAQLRRLSAWRP
jgi:O-antigen/teichoic acid export membrane protein